MIFSIESLNAIIMAMLPLGLIVTGVTTVLKVAFNVQRRYVALISLVLGAVLGFLFVQNHILGIVAGIVTGLSSVGMWEVSTKPFNK